MMPALTSRAAVGNSATGSSRVTLVPPLWYLLQTVIYEQVNESCLLAHRDSTEWTPAARQRLIGEPCGGQAVPQSESIKAGPSLAFRLSIDGHPISFITALALRP